MKPSRGKGALKSFPSFSAALLNDKMALWKPIFFVLSTWSFYLTTSVLR